MSRVSPIIGIDLGTTNCVAGVLRDGAVTLIPNSLGELLTPSAVVRARDTGHLVVGRPAKDLIAADPTSGALNYKTNITSHAPYRVGGTRLTAVELSACVLSALKADAERLLSEPVTRCVVTVPAYFDDAQRHATQTAAELAGFKVERILNEPTAAAIAYGLHKGEDETLFVVVDLGGGTFDVCVMELFEGVLQVRGVGGDGRLGGEDFTLCLARHLAEEAGISFPIAESAAYTLLMRRAELAKRALTRWETTEVELPEAVVGREGCRVALSRADSTRTFSPLLDRMHGPLRSALGGAGVVREQVQEVILVGGATRMPCVHDLMRQVFNREPIHHGNPDLLVAEGAAIQGALTNDDAAVSEIVVTDVASHSLGIESAHEIAGTPVGGFFTPIIHRNTAIPTSRWEQFATVVDNQKEMNLAVFEGEARRTAENRKIGELRVVGIPRKPAPVEVRVRFTCDLNGLLEVEATIPEINKTFTKVFHRQTGAIEGRALELAKSRLAELRADPMDRPHFRDLHARASLLWQEASAADRPRLGALIDALEDASEARNPRALESSFARLREACEALDGNERW